MITKNKIYLYEQKNYASLQWLQVSSKITRVFQGLKHASVYPHPSAQDVRMLRGGCTRTAL